jgi:3D-(3,5/4)-trihydroxycyclohexane-1,2-dione acylhydrolase (decyclizing)
MNCQPTEAKTSKAWALLQRLLPKQGRQQILVATSSVGPGATNMVTAAGVAMANRLPVLFIAGDTFTSRLPDPVLQQVEHFGMPSVTVNDSFKPVTRFWDRITHPAQVLSSLPQAVSTMLDPADCGPAFIGLPQDITAEAYDYPVSFFETTIRKSQDQDQIQPASRSCQADSLCQETSDYRRWWSSLLQSRTSSC